jgi:hypothetical protein
MLYTLRGADLAGYFAAEGKWLLNRGRKSSWFQERISCLRTACHASWSSGPVNHGLNPNRKYNRTALTRALDVVRQARSCPSFFNRSQIKVINGRANPCPCNSGKIANQCTRPYFPS